MAASLAYSIAVAVASSGVRCFLDQVEHCPFMVDQDHANGLSSERVEKACQPCAGLPAWGE